MKILNCKDTKHDWIDSGGLCIGWTGCIGTMYCRNCLSTCKYGRNNSQESRRILWVIDMEGNVKFTNIKAIKEFGDETDLSYVGLKRNVWKQEYKKIKVIKKFTSSTD